MKKKYQDFMLLTFLFVAAIAITSKTYAQEVKKEPVEKAVNEALDFSVKQGLLMAYSLQNRPGLLPKTTDRFGNLQTCRSDWCISGFFPGMLWYLYEYSGREELKKWAHEYTMRVEDQQYTTDNHDVGFMIFCSFGNGFKLTHDTAYLKVIRTASNSLITPFRKSTGCIRSWDYAEWSKQWQYPVIIDNMMNLEILLWTAGMFDEPRFHDIAVLHANTTIKNHYRPDYSCLHVVSYDTITGIQELKQTAQDYSHESAKEYLCVAETQIRTLSSLQYRNALGNNGNFILKHGVGHMPNNTEVDVPLTYADYYFVEALMRFKKLQKL